MRFSPLLTLLALFNGPLSGQEYFTVDDVRRVRKIDGCQYAQRIEAEGATDIAVAPGGNLYIVRNDGDLYEIDPATGAVEQIYAGPGISNNVTSLTSDSNGNLIAMTTGGEIYRYNRNTNLYFMVKDTDEQSSGDVVFYNGKLLFASHYELKETSLSPNEETRTVMCLPEVMYGLANIFEDCQNQRLLAFGATSRRVYELHPEEQAVDTFCQFFGAWEFNGAAHALEYMAADCGPSPVLPAIECGGGISRVENALGPAEIDIYPNPARERVMIEVNFRQPIVATVFDSLGRVVFSGDGPRQEIDVHSWAGGVYYVQIKSREGGRIGLEKLIIAR